jgi:hypothetical protein
MGFRDPAGSDDGLTTCAKSLACHRKPEPKANEAEMRGISHGGYSALSQHYR